MSEVTFHSWGEGEPVAVLLHGIGSASTGFASVAAHLPGWSVLAWDMPGYGATPPLDQEWPDAGDYAQALMIVLENLNVSQVHLLGHSLGALIAARFAVEHPDRVASLVLASPALGHKTPPPALSQAVTDRLAAFDTEGPETFAASRAPRLLANPTGTALATVRNQMARLDPTGHRAAARLLSGGDLLTDVAQLAVPVRVIVGAEDRITPPEAARRCHAACPDALRGSMITCPGAGHALATEAPEALAMALSDAISEKRRVG